MISCHASISFDWDDESAHREVVRLIQAASYVCLSLFSFESSHRHAMSAGAMSGLVARGERRDP